jgi:hypothetical protein
MESQSSFVQKRTYFLSMVQASYSSFSVHLGDLDQLNSLQHSFLLQFSNNFVRKKTYVFPVFLELNSPHVVLSS